MKRGCQNFVECTLEIFDQSEYLQAVYDPRRQNQRLRAISATVFVPESLA